MKLASNLDFQKNYAINFGIQALSGDPTSPVLGQTYLNTTTGQLLTYNGSGFFNKATDSAAFNGQLPAYYLSRANHTGSQLSATISDLASTVQSYRLDQFAAPTTNVSFGGYKITNLADPTSAQDAATKNYVDNAVQQSAAGIDSKPSVRVVATANITLSGTQTIDSVAVVAGDRVLVTAQTVASQNGVYVVAAGAWSRASDADQTGEITPGAFWFVEEGVTNGSSQWRCANTGTVTLGTTSLTVTQFGASSSYTASLGVQKVGNDFRAQVVASGGISAVSGGLQVDTSIVARKAVFTKGDGAATSIVLNHNLGTQDVAVTARLVATNELVLVDWVATDTNNVTLTFSSPPAANSIKAVVFG